MMFINIILLGMVALFAYSQGHTDGYNAGANHVWSALAKDFKTIDDNYKKDNK